MAEQESSPERLLTFTEAGKVAGVSHTTIGKWVEHYGLTARTMPGSRRRRIRTGDLVAYLQALPAAKTESSATSAT